MPFTPDNTFEVVAKVEVSQNIDSIIVVHFEFIDDPYNVKDEYIPRAIVVASYGTLVDDVHVEKFRKKHRFAGADLTSFITAHLQVHTDMKQAIFDFMQDQNLLPAGTVS